MRVLRWTVVTPASRADSADSPWAQRATLAVEEVGATVKHVEIDLKNKPSWYASTVNPASKVPVLSVDGVNIPESHVILELVADLFKGGRSAWKLNFTPFAHHSPTQTPRRAYSPRRRSVAPKPGTSSVSQPVSIPTISVLSDITRTHSERFNQVVWTPIVPILFQGKSDNGPAVLEGIFEIQGLLKK